MLQTSQEDSRSCYASVYSGKEKKKALETVKQQFIELSDPLAINSPFTKTSICHLFTLHALFINLFLIKCNWVLTESHRGGEDPEHIAVSDLSGLTDLLHLFFFLRQLPCLYLFLSLFRSPGITPSFNLL